jgi:hypothetical protein
MRALRDLGLTTIAIAWVAVLVFPTSRRAIARKLAAARRLASRRVTDEEARVSAHAIDAWEDEGGALQGAARVDADSSVPIGPRG